MISERDLIGKTIKGIRIDGFEVYIVFTDGTRFLYEASDGGYSLWNIDKFDKGDIE